MPDMIQGLDELKNLVIEGQKKAQDEFRHCLEEERKKNDELLAAKATGEAVSEIKEQLARLEEATTDAQKRAEKEFAEMKMYACSNAKSDNDEEIKSAFFAVLQNGNDVGLEEPVKSRLAECLTKASEAAFDSPRSLEQTKAMLAGIDTSGGVLVVPPVLEKSVLHYMNESVALYDMAAKTTISSPTYRRDARISRAGASWEGESDAWPETKTPDYGQIEINVHKLIAYPTISRNLIEDSRLDMEAEIMDFTREAMADKLSFASILGDGKRKPMGLLSYPTVKQTKAVDTYGQIGYVVSGQSSSLDTNAPVDAFMDLQGILKTAYRANASWVMNRVTGTALRKLKDKDGNYLWQPPITAGQPDMLLGHSVRYDENMPDIGANNFPVAYGDFRQAMLVVNRRGMTVIRDMTSKPGHIKYLIDLRVGMGLRNFEAVKLLKISA